MPLPHSILLHRRLDFISEKIMALDRMTDAISNQLRSPEAPPRNGQDIISQEKEKDIISLLPFDISSMIFQLAQVESSFIDNVPMRLAHRVASVCRTWRAMALEDPSLWNHIQISMDCGIPFATVALWLRRSVDMPLYLRFTDTKSYRQSYPVIHIMSLLHLQMHRWRSLYIDINSWHSFDSYIVHHLAGTANTLRHFSLKVTEFFVGLFDTRWMATFVCRNLQTLMVNTQIVHAITMDPQLRRLWNVDRLQSLGVYRKQLLDTDSEVRSALRDVSQIAGAVTSLFLQGFYTDSPQQGSIPPRLPGYFPLPNLVSVSFRSTHFRLIRDFLELSSASSLAEVTLDDIFPDRSNAISISNLHLKLLSLSNIEKIQIGRAQFRPYLLDCNHLFVSHTPQFNDALLALMSRPDSDGRWICPHLESMELYRCSNVSDLYLSNLIVSRSNVPGSSVTPIKRLIVNTEWPISCKNRAWFTQNLDYFQWVTQTHIQ